MHQKLPTAINVHQERIALGLGLGLAIYVHQERACNSILIIVLLMTPDLQTEGVRG
jgi:hypothetical protein